MLRSSTKIRIGPVLWGTMLYNVPPSAENGSIGTIKRMVRSRGWHSNEFDQRAFLILPARWTPLHEGPGDSYPINPHCLLTREI